MMIVWNERSIRWFQNASRFTAYNEKLAKLLLAHIRSRNTLCDIGCGAALIDFELAPYIGQITCIDLSPVVIQAVEQQKSKHHVNNITAKCMDGFQAQGEWETVMALFHGGGNVVESYLPLAKEQLILVTHASLKGGFGPEGKQAVKCFDTDSICAYLDTLGIRYHLQMEQLEYGQPFTDLCDAQEFVRAYSRPMETEELDAYLAEKLVKTGDAEFPYYLPKKKNFGIFVIRRDENAQFSS